MASQLGSRSHGSQLGGSNLGPVALQCKVGWVHAVKTTGRRGGVDTQGQISLLATGQFTLSLTCENISHSTFSSLDYDKV